MKVALNTFALSGRLGMAGVGRYIAGLTKGLACVPHHAQIDLLCNRDNASLLAEGAGHKRLTGALTERRSTRVAWEHSVLSVLLGAGRYDVYHAPTFVLPLITPVPAVVSIMDTTWFTHGMQHTRLKRLYFRTLIPYSVRRSARVIAISHATKADIVRLLQIPAEKVIVTHLAVDTEIFRVPTDRARLAEWLTRLGLAPGYILYVGKLEPRKNLVRLVEAFAQVRSALGGCKLVLCGGKGWGYDEVFATVERLDLKDDVVFTGYIADEYLPLVYGGADVFIYPSLYEGFGIPLLEAMACGVPVITSSISSMPEVVGDAGVVIDPYSIEAIGAALVDMLRDNGMREELRARGLQRVQHFTWERMARETLQVYKQCAAAHA